MKLAVAGLDRVVQFQYSIKYEFHILLGNMLFIHTQTQREMESVAVVAQWMYVNHCIE
jgi:hypothetical protein